MRLRRILACGASAALLCLGAGMLVAVPGTAHAQATKVRLLLDWAWLPYHSPFLIAKDKGYYSSAGLDVDIEQGRGSANTAVLLSQGKADMAHINVTNAAQLIGKGGTLKVVGIYQHKSGASFVGIKGKVPPLTGPKSLVGLKIGSTPGGSDGLSLKIFSKMSGISTRDLNIVSLDANAKTAALFGGKIDIVSGDAPAFNSYVRATSQEPETLLLSDHGLPLIGFGFAANSSFLKEQPDAVKKFLAATRKGFQDAAKDPAAACKFMAESVHLAGEQSRCVDYFNGLMALSTPPTDPKWGEQTADEWEKLTATLREAGELESDHKIAVFYTNEFLP